MLTNRFYGRPIASALGEYLPRYQLLSPDRVAEYAGEFLSGDARLDLLSESAARLEATDPGRCKTLM